MASRNSRCAPGTYRKARRAHGGMTKSGLGWIHGGVRWKTRRLDASSATFGTNWMADAPVPITATRFPRRSHEWSHWAEWKTGPAKREAPGMAGMAGDGGGPVARAAALG